MEELSDLDEIICVNWDAPCWKKEKNNIRKNEPEKYYKLLKLAEEFKKYAEELKKKEDEKRKTDKETIQQLVNNEVDPNYKESFGEKKIIIDKPTMKNALEFSYNMVNKCKNQRSGGTMVRSDYEKIYSNIQGKISEVIVHKVGTNNGLDLKPIDLKVYSRGIWDDGDIVTIDNSLNINVKSGLNFTQLLLLTKKDYNSDGSYKHHKCETKKKQRQIFSYVRLHLDRNNILENLKDMNKSKFIDWFLEKYKTITYDIHFCNEILLKKAISKGNIILKDMKLNGKTVMDADNYYLYLFNMNSNITELI
jgi:hypothetical protein